MEQTISNIAVSLPVFLIAIIAHEYAHAWMALRFGDTTARDHGRLTFNPAPHIDPLGTVILPLVMAAMGGIAFGWAKPVITRPSAFSHYRKGIFWVSFAGPLSNLIICTISAFLLAACYIYIPDSFALKPAFNKMLEFSVYINIILAIFNLIPIPPLDGSKMAASFMDDRMMMQYLGLARYSFFIFIFLMFTNIWSYILGPFLMLGKYMIAAFYTLLV